MKFIPPDDPLESALRREAARIASPTPAGMEQRISQAVERAGRPAPSARPFFLWSSLAAAGLVAAVVIATRPTRPVSDSADDRAAAAQLAAAVKSMPAQLWASVQPQAEAVLENEPLRQEATALYADAQSALGFLALNFLPEAAPETSPGRG